MAKNKYSMTEGPLFCQMLMFTFPVMIMGVLQLLFNAADLIIVGQFGTSGSNAVSAIGCTTSLSNLIINFFIGCSAGGGVVVASAIGSGNGGTVKKAVHTIVPLSVVGGAVISVVGILFSRPLLLMMSTPDSIIGLASLYMQIIFAGMVPNMVYNFGASVLRAKGELKKPLTYLIISGVLKVLLNLFFVIVLHLDVAGVAIATVISQTVSAVLVVRALTKQEDDCKFRISEMHFHKEPLLKILRLGIPAGLQACLFSLSNVIIQSSINSLETAYVGLIAGNAAASSIQHFAYVTDEGFKQTAMNYTGQNMGCGKYDRVKKVATISLLTGAAVALLVGGLICIFTRPLLSIYIADSPEAIRWGTVQLVMICAPLFTAVLMDTTTGLLMGMGMSVFPMLATVVGTCVLRVGWVYTVFAVFHRPETLFISYVVSWVLTFIIEITVFAIALHKKIKKQKLEAR